jgi:DNA adenine methylase
LLEPFAGGGIVGLTAAFEGYAKHVTMVELDEQVAAVWNAILGDPNYGRELANRIMSFKLSRDSVQAALADTNDSLVNQAFRTILKNRVNRGGILAPGASLLKDGENSKGLSSRWYPKTLKDRILSIVEIRDRITFIEGDGLEALRNNANRPDIVAFIDPPYTVAARRLYNHWEMNHEELFSIVKSFAGDFLMTYDKDEQVRRLADQHGFEVRAVSMKNTHHTKMEELLIGCDLSWLSSEQ